MRTHGRAHIVKAIRNLIIASVICDWCGAGRHEECKDTETVGFDKHADDKRDLLFRRNLCVCPHKPGLPNRDRLEATK